MDLIEGLFVTIFEKIMGIKIPRPFPIMTYAEAMEKYSHDAPDTRFELFTKTVNDLVADCGFKVFTDAIKDGGIVKAINAKGAGAFSRKEIDDITEYAVSLGAKGLAYIKINEDGLQSPIIKFLGEQTTNRLIETMEGKPGDIIFFGAGEKSTVNLFMSKVRLDLGRRLGLIDRNRYNFTWVIDFPLLEWDKEEKRYSAVHHPFTAPVDEDIPLFDTRPIKNKGKGLRSCTQRL